VLELFDVGAMKISEKEFDRIVKRALRNIPGEIREHLDNLIITVRRRPSRAILKELGIERAEELLGLFQGVPLIERSITAPPLFPDTIFLFQDPLQEMCGTDEELEEQIRITIVHEVAHFLGMDEARLAELGYE
jgi:predicted Zn-dependent protease with MMP-like domain